MLTPPTHTHAPQNVKLPATLKPSSKSGLCTFVFSNLNDCIALEWKSGRIKVCTQGNISFLRPFTTFVWTSQVALSSWSFQSKRFRYTFKFENHCLANASSHSVTDHFWHSLQLTWQKDNHGTWAPSHLWSYTPTRVCGDVNTPREVYLLYILLSPSEFSILQVPWDRSQIPQKG